MRLLTFRLLSLSIILVGGFHLFSQEVDNLRAVRENLLAEIQESSRLLKSMVSSRENTNQQLVLIAREVTVRKQLIESINEDLEVIGQNLSLIQDQVLRLENEVNYIKDEYSRLIRDTYLRRNALDELIFFMSASSFSEAYRRFRLLREYSAFRRQQGIVLLDSREELRRLLIDLQEQKARQEGALSSLRREYASLESSQREKSRLVASLRREEQWLRREIEQKQTQARELERRIMEYIRTATVSVEGADFSNFAGRLGWPVSRGVIVNPFGEHPHPVLRNVTVRNNGVGIQALGNDNVFAVHHGKVSRIVAIPGFNTAVIVRHGNFLTVYANLDEISVRQGQAVNTGALLGKVYKGAGEENGILHFEIWRENQKLDPSDWLAR